MGRVAKATNPRHVAVAKRIVRGMEHPKDALRAEGYSQKTSERGLSLISDIPSLHLAILAEVRNLQSVQLPTADQRANWVRWGLLRNSIVGKDHAVQSLKLLGQDKEVNMFTPDTQIGVIAIMPPASLLQSLLQEPKALEGEFSESLATEATGSEVQSDRRP